MLRLIRAIASGLQSGAGVERVVRQPRDRPARAREHSPRQSPSIRRDGLFVPVLRDVGSRTPRTCSPGSSACGTTCRARTIPPEEMRGYTFILSNFGTFGGRYANPIVQPPTVAILGAGRIRDEVVAVDGKPAVHPILPLSLTFDHRAVTGGEATRFLAAVIADLEKG